MTWETPYSKSLVSVKGGSIFSVARHLFLTDGTLFPNFFHCLNLGLMEKATGKQYLNQQLKRKQTLIARQARVKKLEAAAATKSKKKSTKKKKR